MGSNVAELDVHSEPGYIIIRRASGPPVRYPLAGLITPGDIPTGLTYTQVTSLTALANLIVVLIRTLIARDILDEDFLEKSDLNLDDVIEAIENMGGDYGDPDLSGSET